MSSKKSLMPCWVGAQVVSQLKLPTVPKRVALQVSAWPSAKTALAAPGDGAGAAASKPADQPTGDKSQLRLFGGFFLLL